MEYAARLKRLLALQKREKLDAVVIFSQINRFYFTGIDASNGLLLTSAAGPLFYTDFRYLTMARRTANWLPSRELWKPTAESETLRKIGRHWRRVGFEGSMGVERWLKLKEALPDVAWINITPRLGELRSIKSRAEQKLMRNAIAANDKLFHTLINERLKNRMCEHEIRNEIRHLADQLGEGEAFASIVCAGANGAECHHHPDNTIWTDNQPLLLDLGVKVKHYCSDMTRSLPAKKPGKLWLELFRIVQTANRAAIAAIRGGVPCATIDAIARDIITNAGYGKYFGHGLGHGLGLEVHEPPWFNSTCKTVLRPGMIMTVEPGIYLPGRAGVRIEDVVLVTKSGCEVLTRTPH